jgi:hypothetical protein
MRFAQIVGLQLHVFFRHIQTCMPENLHEVELRATVPTKPGSEGVPGRVQWSPGRLKPEPSTDRLEVTASLSFRAAVLSGSSLTRPTGSFEDIFLTWFEVAGFTCRESGQVSGYAVPGAVLGDGGDRKLRVWPANRTSECGHFQH